MRKRSTTYAGIELPRLPSWHAEAACRSAEPEAFFPTHPSAHDVEPVKRVCASCTHQYTCLGWAVAERHDDGILGGATPSERRAMVESMEATRSAIDGMQAAKKAKARR